MSRAFRADSKRREPGIDTCLGTGAVAWSGGSPVRGPGSWFLLRLGWCDRAHIAEAGRRQGCRRLQRLTACRGGDRPRPHALYDGAAPASRAACGGARSGPDSRRPTPGRRLRAASRESSPDRRPFPVIDAGVVVWPTPTDECCGETARALRLAADGPRLRRWVRLDRGQRRHQRVARRLGEGCTSRGRSTSSSRTPGGAAPRLRSGTRGRAAARRRRRQRPVARVHPAELALRSWPRGSRGAAPTSCEPR